MKKFLLLLFISFVLIPKAAYAQTISGIDYDSVYNKLPIIDNYYEENEDPDEIIDYAPYIGSPYPLIRTSVVLEYNNGKIKPGYYLLKPVNINGYDIIFFKQNGKITAQVPVYEKQLINPEEVYKKPIKPKETLLQKSGRKTKEGFLKVFGRYKKPPDPPRYDLKTMTSDGGRYFEIWLYQEEYLYKTIFKTIRN